MKTQEEILTSVQNALPQLQAEIKRHTGVELELTASLAGSCIKIQSADFADKLCDYTAPIFKTINFETWGGDLAKISSDGIIYFGSNVKYEHWNGGSNGTKYIWDGFAFDVEKEEFLFNENHLLYKK